MSHWIGKTIATGDYDYDYDYLLGTDSIHANITQGYIIMQIHIR